LSDEKLFKTISGTSTFEAEAMVLGSCLVNPSLIDDSLTHLLPEHFCHGGHRMIFQTMQELSKDCIPVDVVSVSETLNNLDLLDSVGGRSYINDLAMDITSTATVGWHADKVVKSFFLRKLAFLAEDLRSEINSDANPLELVGKYSGLLYDVTQLKYDNRFFLPNEPHHLTQLVREKQKHPDKFIGLDTGFTYLDSLLCGMMRSDLICLGAGTSVGKTALAVNIVYNALRAGKRVVYFSLEMPVDQILGRLFAIAAEVDVSLIKTGKMSEVQFFKLEQSEKDLRELPFTVYASSYSDVDYMRSRIMTEMRRQGGLDLVVIDHIHLMDGKGEGYEQMKRITKALKGMAMFFNIPILCLAQLNRAVGDRPELKNLRESGTIEQDSNQVILLHRESETSDLMTAIVAKNRDGPRGDVPLRYIPQFTKFINMTRM